MKTAKDFVEKIGHLVIYDKRPWIIEDVDTEENCVYLGDNNDWDKKDVYDEKIDEIVFAFDTNVVIVELTKSDINTIESAKGNSNEDTIKAAVDEILSNFLTTEYLTPETDE